MNCRTYPGSDCDTDHQLLVATLKVRLAKRQRQHSILPLNLEELKKEKAVGPTVCSRSDKLLCPMLLYGPMPQPSCGGAVYPLSP